MLKKEASSLINEGRFTLSDLADVFLANSGEAIWQLQPLQNGYNTEEAKILVLPETGPDDDPNSHPVYLK